MDTRAMSKGILTHDGLVRLNRHIHQRADHTTGGIYLSGVNIGFNTQVWMCLEYHGNLLQRSVTCTLTDTVDGNLNLTGSAQHTGNGIGSSHTQVVMTMSGQDTLSCRKSIYVLIQILDFLKIFVGNTEACCVGDVTNCSTSLGNSIYDTCQILVVGTTGILGIELHILNILLGILNSSHGTLDNLFRSRVELIADVTLASTNTRMDTLVLGILQGIGSYVNILLNSTCQRTNGWPCYSLTDFYY